MPTAANCHGWSGALVLKIQRKSVHEGKMYLAVLRIFEHRTVLFASCWFRVVVRTHSSNHHENIHKLPAAFQGEMYVSHMQAMLKDCPNHLENIHKPPAAFQGEMYVSHMQACSRTVNAAQRCGPRFLRTSCQPWWKMGWPLALPMIAGRANSLWSINSASVKVANLVWCPETPVAGALPVILSRL